MTMKDKKLETDRIVAPVERKSNFNFSAKMFAKIANINNYVLPLPMILIIHGNTF